VDADAHLVGVEVVGAQEGHVVGGHHRHALGDGEIDAGLDALGLILAPGAGQLQVEAVAEGAEPAVEQASASAR
jgi:hypothetical protein